MDQKERTPVPRAGGHRGSGMLCTAVASVSEHRGSADFDQGLKAAIEMAHRRLGHVSLADLAAALAWRAAWTNTARWSQLGWRS
jgi:hypothetical protein